MGAPGADSAERPSEAALLDQHGSSSISLIHTWAWRVGENRDCVFYKTTGRGNEVMRHVPLSPRLALCLHSSLTSPQSGERCSLLSPHVRRRLQHPQVHLFLSERTRLLCLCTGKKGHGCGRVRCCGWRTSAHSYPHPKSQIIKWCCLWFSSRDLKKNWGETLRMASQVSTVSGQKNLWKVA